ncbi:MAG: ECF-type sigma factor, partial [Myxococcota bacterium]
MLTLQPTELVNECYLKLVRARDFEWNDRHHFFAISAKIMRRFIVDFLRRKGAKRRGGRMPFRIDADQVADGRWAWLTIAQVQRELGLVAAAKESLTQAESAFTDSGAADPALSTELRLARAEAANAGGETVTARSQAQTVVETNGEQAHRALYVVAQSLLLETKNEAALAALDDLQRRLQIDRAADTALGRRVQLTRATTLQALGEFARALEVLQALRRRQDEVLPASGLYISVIPPVVVGVLVGILAAIMGVGGGFIMVPAMIYIL